MRIAFGLAVLLGCAPHARDAAPIPAAAHPPAAHGMALRIPAAEAARLIEQEPFELRDLQHAYGGVTRVDHGIAHFPARGIDLPVKWKVAPSGGEGWDNVPRKEVAAFVIQRWFLDPEDWIVPPTTIRCVPVEQHAQSRDVAPVVEGTRCVLGMIAAWLEDVHNPDAILDEERFGRDPEYARQRADMNLVAYLIDHRDGRLANFLVPKADDTDIYMVDNGIAFGALVYNFFRPNWNVVRVPALPRAAVERLRRVTAEDVDALLVVSDLRADAAGVLQPIAHEAPVDASKGARLQRGHAQFGLTADEAAGVAARLARLLARVSAGEIALF